MPRSRFAILFPVCVALLGASPAPVVAQAHAPNPRPAEGTKPAKRPAFTGGTPPAAAPLPSKTVEFSPDQVAKFNEAGLTLRLPPGALAQRSSDLESQLQIIPEDQSWRILIRAPRVTDATMTIASFTDRAIQAIQEKNGVVRNENKKDVKNWRDKVDGTFAKMLERTPAPGQPAQQINNSANPMPFERFYIQEDQGADNPKVIRGFTVFAIEPQKFCTIELLVAEPAFAAARPLYEAMIASATFVPADDLNIARGTAVQAGKILFQNLDDATFAKIITANAERWFRLYLPSQARSKKDETEVGYMRVRARVGKRGELDPKKTAGEWKAADRQEGYIVQVDARLLQEPSIVDTQGIYFVTKDRKEEAWTVRTGVNDKKGKPATSEEVGARVAQQISVVVKATGQPNTDIKPFIQNDAYVSMPDALLLPQIMIRQRAVAEYGFYTWQSARGKICLRRDSLEQPSDRPGTWRITTRIGDDDKTQISLYKDNGELITRTSPDGSILEPTTLDELVRLWKEKNLPMN